MKWWVKALVFGVLLVASFPGVARATGEFRLLGQDGAAPRAGAVADEIDFMNTEGVAVAIDGTLVVQRDEQLHWIAGGRLTKIVRIPRALVDASAELSFAALAFEPGGALLMVAGHAVYRYDKEGHWWRIAGALGEGGERGEGGPAIAARLDAPRALSVDAEGRILVVDGGRVRRIGTDGIITTVAGPVGLSDQGPEGLSDPRAAVGLPDGGLAVLEDLLSRTIPRSVLGVQVTVVNAAGVIRTLGQFDGGSLAMDPAGGLLMAAGEDDDGPVLVRRLWLDDRMDTVLARGPSPDADWYLDWCSGNCTRYVTDAVPIGDGGIVLIENEDLVSYLPPAGRPAALLAVAVGRNSRLPRRHLRVAVRSTRPSRVHVRASGAGRTATRDVNVAPGESWVDFPELTRPAKYDIALRATGGGAVFTAWGQAIAGGLTPGFSRRYLLEGPPSYTPRGAREGDRVTCTNTSRWTVRCGIQHRRRCTRVLVRVHPDGRLDSRRLSARRGRC
jgi:hypothetical protein